MTGLPFLWLPWRFVDAWGAPTVLQMAIFQTSSSAAALMRLSELEAKYLDVCAQRKQVEEATRAQARELRALARERWKPTSGDPLVDELRARFKWSRDGAQKFKS